MVSAIASEGECGQQMDIVGRAAAAASMNRQIVAALLQPFVQFPVCVNWSELLRHLQLVLGNCWLILEKIIRSHEILQISMEIVHTRKFLVCTIKIGSHYNLKVNCMNYQIGI